MKYIAACWVGLLCATLVHGGATLKEARKELQEGNYAEACEAYEALAKNAADRLPATLGLSQAWESRGQYDKALGVVETLLQSLPAQDADLLARQAELLHSRGRWEEAEKIAAGVLAKNDDNFLAHWVLGQVYRDSGRADKANEQFLWFVRASQKKDITDPVEMCLAGLAGLERARALHLTDEYQNILDNYLRAATTKDKLYWQGEYEAGRVFVDKHDQPKAFRAFTNALLINPLSAEVLTCKGKMAMSMLEVKDAERYAERALRINPSYIPAMCLMAEIHWFSDETDAAMKMLNRARIVNPRAETTLARLAACYFAKRNDKEFQSLIQEAQKNNPRCYTFFNDLASLLEQRKFNADAEKYYDIAVKMQPNFPEAQTGLGMLYMRMAKEAEAHKILEQAFKADPFSVRVNNSLLVLDHLQKYESLKTEHFIIRYDKKNDVVLANFMASYLEDIYKDLAAQFDYHPKGPFLIEIFDRHEMFSGRVVALPDLHTIGACTGPLVAMVSPHDISKRMPKFNWNRVIRHELVHVFNLQQTGARVPHWFTEGLAVRYEGKDIPPSWHALLAEKYQNKDLLNLDNILLGFVRPRSQDQWQQAYLQSLLYVEYLTKTHGEPTIGKMLAAFAEGLDTGLALEKACGVKKDAFELGYREFLGERVKNIATRPIPKQMTLKELRAAHAKTPDDLDIAARLADANYKFGKRKDAKDLADLVLSKDPKNTTAVCVKAQVLRDEKQPDSAYALLDSVVTDDLKDVAPLKVLADIQIATKKYSQAARTCERARKLDPHNVEWLKALTVLYVTHLKGTEPNKLKEVLEELANLDVDFLLPRESLAGIFHDAGNQAKAEQYARMALEIDVTNRNCQRILVDALMQQNKQDEANRLKTMFGL